MQCKGGNFAIIAGPLENPDEIVSLRSRWRRLAEAAPCEQSPWGAAL